MSMYVIVQVKRPDENDAKVQPLHHLFARLQPGMIILNKEMLHHVVKEISQAAFGINEESSDMHMLTPNHAEWLIGDDVFFRQYYVSLDYCSHHQICSFSYIPITGMYGARKEVDDE